MDTPKILCYGKDCNSPIVPRTPALEISGLQFSYPENPEPVLEDVSLTIQPGERVALVGPNGAGKSTLMNLILGIVNIQKGAIKVYGNKAASCRHRTAMVPQKLSIDWNFPVTVREVVTMGRYVHLGWFRKPGKGDREIVDEALETMEIQDLADRQVSELSGGQQQRVMLARTLAHEADFLLLDEPLNHVDFATQELMFHTIERLCSEGKSALVSTHDLGILTVHFSRALFLDKTIIADGPVESVLTGENVARAYGVDFHKKGETPWLK